MLKISQTVPSTCPFSLSVESQCSESQCSVNLYVCVCSNICLHVAAHKSSLNVYSMHEFICYLELRGVDAAGEAVMH